MRLFLLSIIASGVSCAPLILSALSPKFTSVQNIKGSNYSGATPPPWITGFMGSPYGSYGGYGSKQVTPPPPPPPPFQVNPAQTTPPNTGLGQQPNVSNPAGSQGTLLSSQPNNNDPNTPVNDSATFSDSTPPPVFQYTPN